MAFASPARINLISTSARQDFERQRSELKSLQEIADWTEPVSQSLSLPKRTTKTTALLAELRTGINALDALLHPDIWESSELEPRIIQVNGPPGAASALCGRTIVGKMVIFRNCLYDADVQDSSSSIKYGVRELDKQIIRNEYARERISQSVRDAVWRRDEGKCARCGGRNRLEFDHIVPVSKGGGNTARNIELLCESCNRQKGCRIE